MQLVMVKFHPAAHVHAVINWQHWSAGVGDLFSLCPWTSIFGTGWPVHHLGVQRTDLER